MESTDDRRSETANEARPTPAGAAPAEARDGSRPPQAEGTAHPDHQAADPAINPPSATLPPAARAPSHLGRKWLLLAGAVVGLAVGGHFLIPWVETMLNTVSTDDAYVNGHVTFVAPRVAGQVSRVLVDDNYRVKTGDLLVQLDKEPYQVQVVIKKAAVGAAEADLTAAQAQVRSIAAQARANRFQLEHAIEDVNTQVANLRANMAMLNSRKATLELARNNLKRGEELVATGGISKEELDQRRQTVKVDEAAVDQALQAVYATRVGLGLPAQPPKGHDLTEVPADLDQSFSSVRQALGQLLESAAQFGYAPTSWNATPKQALEDFYKQDPKGNLDKIFAQILPHAPAIKQAEAKLHQARADLDQALLNLRYCDIVSEIDGVVTRRNVNPGNNVSVGQSLMAVRSLTEIWIDANFKETQLADLRIGQRVRCEVDMYGSRREFEGRITGFTMGTGQTLALLPPQNATGNFVKIVQRLPVRIELTNYDPKAPLFVGLSVVPYVYSKEPPTGPHAGEVLQPLHPLPQGPTVPSAREASQGVAPLPKGPSGP
jgi:membrane fusion protein (multidrug efflux system)